MIKPPPPAPTTHPEDLETKDGHPTPHKSKDDISETGEDDVECQGRSKLDIRNPECQVKKIEIGHPDTEPIPAHNMRVGQQTQPNLSRLVRLANSGDNKVVSGTTRAVNPIAVGGCDQIKQE